MATPSYFAIIPANVRYCKDLEPAAKLLYGEITALTSKEGYCWASNNYFAELYGTDIRTVKRWIQSLRDNGFIFIDITIEGIQRRRKIRISPEIQINLTKGQKCHDVGKDLSPRGGKNSPCINTTSETSIEETPPSPSRGNCVAFGKFVRLMQDELVELQNQYGEKDVCDMIDQINDHLASTGKKPYKDYAATIRNWMRRRQSQPTKAHGPVDKNRKIAELVCARTNSRDIEATNEGIIFVNHGAGKDLFIPYSEFGFKEQVILRLKKMNLDTSWM